MKSNKPAVCLVVALLTTQIYAAAFSSLSKISSKLNTLGKNVQTKVDKISDFLESDEVGELADTVSSSIEAMGEAMDGITDSDVLGIVGGAMDMISAIGGLIPGTGEIVNVVFGLFGSILGAIGGGDDDVGSIVKREIEKALNNYDDSELRAEAEGTLRVYRLSQAYLNSVEEGEPMNEHEVATLAANVPIYSGVKFLGILSSKIQQYTQSTEQTQVLRAAEYLELYVTLAVVRSALMWEMYSVVREAPNSDWTASAIKRVAEVEQDHDKDFLQFLTNPVYTKAIFFACFNPSDWPTTMKYMTKNSLIYQRLDFLASGKHFLRPETRDRYMTMDGGRILGTKTLDDQCLFYFDTISADDNVFYIRSVKWPSKYVIIKSGFFTNMGSSSEPGDNGKWKVIMFDDGKYLLSNIGQDNAFIYMRTGMMYSMASSEEDPGTDGHWVITEINSTMTAVWEKLHSLLMPQRLV